MTDEASPRDRSAVREANERFYRAFESLDLAEMDAIWAHGDHVACVHPGWNRLHGWDAVRRSWAAIFQGTTEMRFTITDVRVEHRGDLGWVHCTENIISENRGSLSITAILATNVFERRADRWLLVHHHASHILAPRDPEPEAA
ncbi:MAG TPA: nuclear transport factor 2 family protein [Methylomirabilota bacterium]